MQKKKPVNRMTMKDRAAYSQAETQAKAPAPTKKKGEMTTQTVEITGYRSDGQGIGRVNDGRVIFVPGTIRGEIVHVQYIDNEDRYLTGKIVDFMVLSDHRIGERYPALSWSGFGDLQFLPISAQEDVKISILKDQFQRIGKLSPDDTKIHPIISSPKSWGYMAEIAFDLSPDGTIRLPEVFEPRDPQSNEEDMNEEIDDLLAEFIEDTLAAVPCPPANEAINDQLQQIKFEPDTGIRRVIFRSDRDGLIQLLIPGEDNTPDLELESDLAASVVYVSESGSVVLSGDSTIVQDVGGIALAISDRMPFYLNPEVYKPLFGALDRELPSFDGKTALTIHPGAGLWAKWALLRGASSAAIVEDESEIDDFIVNFSDEQTEDAEVSLYVGFPNQVLPSLETTPDWIIVDLTQQTLHANSLNALAACALESVLLIGEDVAVLARNCAGLVEKGYTIGKIYPFDSHPQTATFGTVIWMTKKE